MPRRKKLPETSDIIGLGNPDKLTVQKSNPLQSLAKTDLTLPELKLLDVYLARIDSHDPEKRTVIIDRRYRLLVFFWRMIPRWLWERLPIKN